MAKKKAAKSKAKMSNAEMVASVLKRNPGKEFTAGDIARKTGLTSKQVSDILWRLWMNDQAKSKFKGIYTAA